MTVLLRCAMHAPLAATCSPAEGLAGHRWEPFAAKAPAGGMEDSWPPSHRPGTWAPAGQRDQRPAWRWENACLGRRRHGRRDQWRVYSLYIHGRPVLTRVQKWGNSLGLRIPRGLAEQIGLGAGSEVSLSAKDGELVVKPSIPARFTLDELLAGVTPENLHSSVDTGQAVGQETF